MKTKNAAEDPDPLDREIDFSKGRRNPFFVEFHGPAAIRVLEPDLAELFPDNDSVNAALRTLAAGRKKVSARRVVAKKERR
jgi:hypothetical protein